MNDSALAVGMTLSHYRIVSKIGAGGMGEFCLAEDTQQRRTEGEINAHTYWNVLFGFSLRVDGRRTNRGTNARTHSDRDKGWSTC